MIRCVVVGIDHWEDLTKPFVVGLYKHNPSLLETICIVDNVSENMYPTSHPFTMLTLTKRVGYGTALNYGAGHVDWDWLLCCNNDCVCEGNVTDIIERLDPDAIYGNAWKYDGYSGKVEHGLPAVVDSAYLLISRKVWEAVGEFDPKMDAAFEEIDFQLRALEKGFRVDVADLPIIHLNMHTRRELEGYEKRWYETEQYFLSKYPNRKVE